MSASDETAEVAVGPGGGTTPVGGQAMAALAGPVAQGRCILFVGAGVHYPAPAGC